MGMLIDQFCQAIEEWSAATGEPPDDVLVSVLTDTGAVWHPQVVGVEQGDLAAGDLTIEGARIWLNLLTEQVHIEDEFLVLSLIASVERWLRRLVDPEYYRAGIEEREKYIQNLERVLADPEERDALLSRMNQRRESSGAEPVTEETLRGTIDFTRRLIGDLRQRGAEGSAYQREHLPRLTEWQRVTAPILEAGNLRRARDEYWRRMFGQ